MMHDSPRRPRMAAATALLLALTASVRAQDPPGAAWRTVFEDRFERAELGDQWDIILDAGRIVDRRLYIAGSGNCAVAMIARQFASDVRVEFDAEIDSSRPPCDIACGLGGSSFLNYGYLLQFGARGNQANQFYAPIARDTPFHVDEKPPFVIEYGKVYRCVAVKEGRRITYTVNGTKLLDVTDPDVLGGPGFGGVCVVTWSGMYVDNVRVSERVPPAPDGPRLIDRPESLDIGYRWENRQLGGKVLESLSEPVRAGIEAYNRRDHQRAFQRLAAVRPATVESAAALAYVLGDLAYDETEQDQQTVLQLAREAAGAHPSNPAAANLALLADWFSRVTIRSRDKRDCERVFQAGPANNPFYYKAMLYRARYHLAWARESGLARQSREAMELFAALKKLWPDHAGIAALTGEQLAWGPELTRAETEGPRWARLLQEGLARSHVILNWWFTRRQSPDGQLGGGWGDDVELLRSWVMPAGVTSAGAPAVTGIRRLADGIWKHVLNEQGYPDGGDVEHAAEPAADTQPLMMFLRYGDPQYVERNLKTARFLRDVAMGINERGGLQFKSCIFGTDGVNMHPSGLGQNIYHSRAMRHFAWLAWYGIPEARDVLVRWADNIRDVAMAEIGPKPSGYMPFTMFWPSGSIYPPENRFWLDPNVHCYGTRPDKLWKLHFPLFSAYDVSRDRKFLAPIERVLEVAREPGGHAYDESLPRDDIRNLWADMAREACPDVCTLYRWLTGSDAYGRTGLSEPLQLQVTGDVEAFVKQLEAPLANLRFNWAEKTSEVLQTDRFDMPGDFLIFSAYTGSVTAPIEDGLIPTMGVTWDTPDLNFAALVMASSRDYLRVLVHNFNGTVMPAGLKPWQLVPGEYRLNQGVQSRDDEMVEWQMPVRVAHRQRAAPIRLDLAAGRTSVIELKLVRALEVPPRLPDLAVGDADVVAAGDETRVTVHNIGAADAGPFSVVLEKQEKGEWRTVAEASVPGLAAIRNLEPSTINVTLKKASAGPDTGCRVAIDPEDQVEELNDLNNEAVVPGAGGETAGEAQRPTFSPITVRLADHDGFATCTNRLHPDNRIGYRFHEHTPMIHGDIPKDLRSAGIDPAEITRLERRFARSPGVLRYVVQVDQEHWTPQQWTFYMAPVDDGIDLLLVVETGEQGLNEFYGIQQCFRMSGLTNEEWRHPIARTPAFSEYDLWNVEKDKADKTSLTYVLRDGEWEPLPAVPESVGSRTPLGIKLDMLLTGGNLGRMPIVGPYEARMFEPTDCGLITRTSADGGWVCGIHWDRTSHVTDHHPADCLHSIVNIGGMPPRAKRAVRGKIYWFQGTLGDLLEHWRRDWSAGPTNNAS